MSHTDGLSDKRIEANLGKLSATLDRVNEEILDRCVERVKTFRIRSYVNASVDGVAAEYAQFLATKASVDAKVNDPAFQRFMAQTQPKFAEHQAVAEKMKTNAGVMKDIFTDALEQAVYGNGGIAKVDIKSEQSNTSWQQQLKTGPINLDRRLEAARKQVEEKLHEAGLAEPVFMKLYDNISKAVKADINKQLVGR